MAEFKPTCVKDVPAHDFITAYAAHLKSNDKVSIFKALAPCLQTIIRRSKHGVLEARITQLMPWEQE